MSTTAGPRQIFFFKPENGDFIVPQKLEELGRTDPHRVTQIQKKLRWIAKGGNNLKPLPRGQESLTISECDISQSGRLYGLLRGDKFLVLDFGYRKDQQADDITRCYQYAREADAIEDWSEQYAHEWEETPEPVQNDPKGEEPLPQTLRLVPPSMGEHLYGWLCSLSPEQFEALSEYLNNLDFSNLSSQPAFAGDQIGIATLGLGKADPTLQKYLLHVLQDTQGNVVMLDVQERANRKGEKISTKIEKTLGVFKAFGSFPLFEDRSPTIATMIHERETAKADQRLARRLAKAQQQALLSAPTITPVARITPYTETKNETPKPLKKRKTPVEVIPRPYHSSRLKRDYTAHATHSQNRAEALLDLVSLSEIGKKVADTQRADRHMRIAFQSKNDQQKNTALVEGFHYSRPFITIVLDPTQSDENLAGELFEKMLRAQYIRQLYNTRKFMGYAADIYLPLFVIDLLADTHRSQFAIEHPIHSIGHHGTRRQNRKQHTENLKKLGGFEAVLEADCIYKIHNMMGKNTDVFIDIYEGIDIGDNIDPFMSAATKPNEIKKAHLNQIVRRLFNPNHYAHALAILAGLYHRKDNTTPLNPQSHWMRNENRKFFDKITASFKKRPFTPRGSLQTIESVNSIELCALQIYQTTFNIGYDFLTPDALEALEFTNVEQAPPAPWKFGRGGR